jgi:hypothetical protein
MLDRCIREAIFRVAGKQNHLRLFEVRPSNASRHHWLWCGEPDAIANAIGYAKFYIRFNHIH